jgi:hypothetical protein
MPGTATTKLGYDFSEGDKPVSVRSGAAATASRSLSRRAR